MHFQTKSIFKLIYKHSWLKHGQRSKFTSCSSVSTVFQLFFSSVLQQTFIKLHQIHHFWEVIHSSYKFSNIESTNDLFLSFKNNSFKFQMTLLSNMLFPSRLPIFKTKRILSKKKGYIFQNRLLQEEYFPGSRLASRLLHVKVFLKESLKMHIVSK